MMEQHSNTNLTELAVKVLAEYGITPQQVQIVQNKGLKTLWRFSYGGKFLP